jgi:quercetin dioxygenase-like cupin family protein
VSRAALSVRAARLLTLASGLALAAAAAATSAGEGTAHPLMRHALPEAPGKQVTLLTVDYAPGQTSSPHSHPGSVFAYVVEGSVVSQLEGEPARTFRAGEGWYEPPGAHHIVSRNASTTQPARLVVWLMANEGEAVKKPLPR